MQAYFVCLLICIIALPSCQVLGQNDQTFENEDNQNQNQDQQPLNQDQQSGQQEYLSNVAPIQGFLNPFIHLAGSGIHGLMGMGMSAMSIPMSIMGNGQALVAKSVNSFAPYWTPPQRNPYFTSIFDFSNFFQPQTRGMATPTSPNQNQ